jgi:hypothetical protein
VEFVVGGVEHRFEMAKVRAVVITSAAMTIWCSFATAWAL